MDYSPEFLEKLKSVTGKRPRTVIDHILQHGFITTEELKNKYGYNHPPRAVRDVREQDIPLETFRVEGSDGRKIAAYRFGDYKQENVKKTSGRTALSKKLKDELISRHGCKCFIYNEYFNERELQIDHRVPYEVSGDDGFERDIEEYMLLSPSANRAKSWSCEHCENWLGRKDASICQKCYWAYPENYTHVAMVECRRADIIWVGEEIPLYESLKEHAKYVDKDIQQIIKEILKTQIK
jgi:hypothetical protein